MACGPPFDNFCVQDGDFLVQKVFRTAHGKVFDAHIRGVVLLGIAHSRSHDKR